MDVTIKIEKRYAFGIMGLLVLGFGLFFVGAFGGEDPSVMGHSTGEIEVSWNSITDIPTDIADGDDSGGSDTNAETLCGDNEFLDGDGSCVTANNIIDTSGISSEFYTTNMVSDQSSGNFAYCPSGYKAIWCGVTGIIYEHFNQVSGEVDRGCYCSPDGCAIRALCIKM